IRPWVRLWVGSDKDIVEFSTRFTKPVVVFSDRDATIVFSGRVGEVSASEVTVEVTALCEGVKVLGQTKARIRL
ncbi:MAG: dehydratase, partial [Actinomycetota bacterium]